MKEVIGLLNKEINKLIRFRKEFEEIRKEYKKEKGKNEQLNLLISAYNEKIKCFKLAKEILRNNLPDVEARALPPIEDKEKNCPTCKGSGKLMNGKYRCGDCYGSGLK